MSRSLEFMFYAAFFVSQAFGQQDVLTGGYGNARTNADLNESILTPSSVAQSTFGKSFSLSVDGQIYAQPLYQQNVTIGGNGVHNVLFTATMHNTVYAFDADGPSTPLWSVNLGPSVPVSNYSSDIGAYTDINPENGILGTPVIDPATGTLYLVAATLENGTFLYRLHALDTGSGTERFGAPVVINAQVAGIGASSVSGSVPFVASQHMQRPALLLLKGIVYVSFGSHGDAVPFHGWIFGYSALNVQNKVSVYNASPNGDGGSFWQSGRGPAADDQGNVYAVSSNGDTDDVSNFSDNVLRLNSNATGVADYFSPFNVQFLNDNDDDLGAGGPLLVPGTNLLLTGGKQGVLYVLDRAALGHSNSTDSQIPQSINTNNFGIFNMALWSRPDGAILYLHTANSAVTAYRLTGNTFTPSPTFQSVNGFDVPFQGMTVSANGGQAGSGILWVLRPSSYPLPSSGVMHAYNADDLSEIWNSTMNDGDAPGGFVKFANPTVANGKVYVPTMDDQLVVYGLTGNGGGSGVTPVVTGVVNAASYANGAIAPGEIVAIFGQNLGPASLTVGAFNNSGQMATQVARTQVTFDGIPAPLLYTSSGALAAIVPYEIAGENSVAFQMTFNGQISDPQTLAAGASSPGIFSADSSGSGPGAILNQDYSLNSPTNPAQAGSLVVLYATGGGQTNPSSNTGAITTAASPLVGDVSVTVGGQPATILYAGNAGGEVAGVMQVNLVVPSGVSGEAPVVVTVAGQSSQATVTVSVR